MKFPARCIWLLTLASVATWSIAATAQTAASTNAAPPVRTGGRGGMQRPVPVEISTNHHLTFRLSAPNAQSVRLVATDIPNTGNSVAMTNNSGVWEATLGPVEPGAYRYYFNVDNLNVVTPRSPAAAESFTTSESANNTWSVVYVPGAEFMDIRDVPHGAIEVVTYFSKSLNRFRRMHVYTPPGYDQGSGKYPVLYLLHGFQDGDDTWTTVGRAGYILDNLIAGKKAGPMILVMPSGQTSAGFGGGGRRGVATRDEFAEDLLGDIIPFVDDHYRVYADPSHRAIAGMTSGGSQALNLAFGAPDKFSYLGLFSTSAGSGNGNFETWEQAHLAALDNPELKKNLKLLWAASGQDDPNIHQYRDTLAMLEKHGFKPVFVRTKGENSWINWRSNLNEFAPQLFK